MWLVSFIYYLGAAVGIGDSRSPESESVDTKKNFIEHTYMYDSSLNLKADEEQAWGLSTFDYSYSNSNNNNNKHGLWGFGFDMALSPKKIGLSCDARALIWRHEGKRRCVYTDTMGHPTIGIGYNLDNAGARDELKKIG